MVALTTTSIAWVIFLLLCAGWVVYFLINRGAARHELGSEIELAPNRRPYYDDEMLEGKRLERLQFLGVLMLGVLVLALPLYWLHEPSRQKGAKDFRTHEYQKWGSGLFETTANGGFNCSGCHGGMNATGGNAPAAITNAVTGQVESKSWYAPALNSVFYRFSEDEVRFIITYGRPFSPMSAWGTDGGGPMNTQQITTLLEYLKSIQQKPEGCLSDDPFPAGNDPLVCSGGTLPQAKRDEIAAASKKAAEDLVSQGKYTSVDAAMGEALFNLNLDSGAYSCARCHTPGWSYGDPGVPGSGAYGWNLTGGAVNTHFPAETDMITFVSSGSTNGKKYGQQSMGSGRMPGFGAMLTQQQIKQIVEYVRGL